MGCDCYNYLPFKTSRKDVEEFLTILGFVRLPKDRFTQKGASDFLFHPDDYKYFEGVYAEVYFDQEKGLTVHTHNRIWRSRSDTDFHNYTIKQLRKRFGGHFYSDNGENRYLTNESHYIENEEAGCYQAYGRFFQNIQRTSFTIETWLSAKTNFGWSSKQIGQLTAIDLMHPLVATVNMAIPIVVSIIEDYFRSTYIALLKYSTQKETIVRNYRIQGEDLTLLTKGEISIEDAIVHSRSFQNMKRITEAYKELDKSIDLNGILQKPYLRGKKSIYETYEKIINLRHRIIHNAELVLDYTPRSLLRDIRTIHAGIERFYLSLISLYGWSDEHPDLRRIITPSEYRLQHLTS